MTIIFIFSRCSESSSTTGQNLSQSASELDLNRATMDLNSEKIKTMFKNVIICTSCETNNASHYCNETVCSSEDHIEYLCSDCVKIHKRLHVISPLQFVSKTATMSSNLDSKMKTLNEMFPELDIQIIGSVLENNDCNMEKTVDQLISLFR